MDVRGQIKLYRKDFNGRAAYSRRISAQEYIDGHKGDWINLYESVQMPKNTNLPDGCIIEVKSGFESLYKSKGEIKRKIVVKEYNMLDMPRNEQDANNYNGFQHLQDDDVPF